LKALPIGLIAVLFFSSSSNAEIGDSLILCKHNKMVRTLRIEKGSEKCTAIYTKQGVDSVIGSGQYQQSCEDVVTGVRKNLEEAKWQCREVKEARTSAVNTTSAE
jgi:hypothetical protein